MGQEDDRAPLLGEGAVNASVVDVGGDGKGAAAGSEPSAAARMRFTVFNLGNTIMGGGILSLSYAMLVRVPAHTEAHTEAHTHTHTHRQTHIGTHTDT
jgi:hypothetical protein